jgi:hypothetical protein
VFHAEENKAVAKVEELHKTEVHLAGVHLTDSAGAKDSPGGGFQLSVLIEQGHEKQQLAKQ